MKKIKIPLLYLLSFALSVLPVVIYVVLHKDRYFTTLPQQVKLSVGGAFLVVIVLLKAMGKLKSPGRVGVFGAVFLLCYLLEAVLNDLIVLSFLALVGEVMDGVCQAYIRRAKAQREAQRTACEVKRALSGRV